MPKLKNFLEHIIGVYMCGGRYRELVFIMSGALCLIH